MTLRSRIRRLTGWPAAYVATAIIVAGFCWAVGEWPFEWVSGR